MEFILKDEVFVLTLTLIELLWWFSEEPLLVLMSVLSVVTLILLVRMFFYRKVPDKRDLAKPHKIMAEDEEQIFEDKIASPEIHPILINGEVDVVNQMHLKKTGGFEFRPILGPKKPEECEYCSIFKDLGTVVCPNCGRPLNITHVHEN